MSGQRIIHAQNLDTITDDLPSPALWSRLDFDRCRWDRSYGIGYHDNFVDLPLAPTLTTQIAFGKYKAYAAAGCTIGKVSAINSVETFGGALAFGLDTDDDESAFGESGNTFRLSGVPSTSGPLIFEACYAQNSIATNMAAVFFGLAESETITFGANTPMNSGDAITNTWSGIGFRIEEDGLGVVDTVYTDRATSFTNIGDAEAGTLAANTFKNFGLIYDPNDTARCIRFFVDNRELTTAMTRAALVALTNLDANNVGPMAAFAADSGGTSFIGYLKWWRIAQLVPGGTLSRAG